MCMIIYNGLIFDNEATHVKYKDTNITAFLLNTSCRKPTCDRQDSVSSYTLYGRGWSEKWYIQQTFVLTGTQFLFRKCIINYIFYTKLLRRYHVIYKGYAGWTTCTITQGYNGTQLHIKKFKITVKPC